MLRLAAVLALALAAGCAASPLSTVPGTPEARVPAARPTLPPGLLYVADAGATPASPQGNVAAYALPGNKRVRLLENLCNPSALMFGSKGMVYVLSTHCGEDPGSVSFFKPDSDAPAGVVGAPFPYVTAMALDEENDLYVAQTRGHTIEIYAPESTSRIGAISSGLNEPVDMAFDATGHLYVLNQGKLAGTNGTATGYVAVFRTGGNAPVRYVTAGIDSPQKLAFDPKGNLYVLNAAERDGTNGTVAEYPPNASSPSRTVAENEGSAMAFDRRGNLYVAKCPHCWGRNANGWIDVFAPGKNTPSRRIADGVRSPSALAVARDGTLYVANVQAGNVQTYAPNGSTVLHTLKGGSIAAPQGLRLRAF